MTKGTSDVTKIVAEQTLQKQGFLWIWSTYDELLMRKVKNNITRVREKRLTTV
ncbi:MAG: hypothetical protein NC299_16080 [Lachnospiraceae bacterium]|nr:hypothetical protein [Ruminococcus sp.]MCM1276854.1 hypothetical protein [Lachnospiraceae bacterium]